MTEGEFLDEFPDLTEDDILAWYSYLADDDVVPRRPPGHQTPL